MSNHYSDPTANAAIGAVDKEIRLMRKKAKRLKILRQNGLLTQREIDRARKEFTGIYRRFLLEAMSDEEKTPEPEGSGVCKCKT